MAGIVDASAASTLALPPRSDSSRTCWNRESQVEGRRCHTLPARFISTCMLHVHELEGNRNTFPHSPEYCILLVCQGEKEINTKRWKPQKTFLSSLEFPPPLAPRPRVEEGAYASAYAAQTSGIRNGDRSAYATLWLVCFCNRCIE